jgi:hypothetical protein
VKLAKANLTVLFALRILKDRHLLNVNVDRDFLNKICHLVHYALIFVSLAMIPTIVLLALFQIKELLPKNVTVSKDILMIKNHVAKNVIINVKLAIKKKYALHATRTHTEQPHLNVTVFLATMKISYFESLSVKNVLLNV